MGRGAVLGIVIDCENPLRLAEFWAGLVGGTVVEETFEPDWISLAGVDGLRYLSFQRVPESKHVKNRLHLDLDVDDIAAAGAHIITAGGSASGGVVDEGTNLLQVMTDPEGNEFCLIQRSNSNAS